MRRAILRQGTATGVRDVSNVGEQDVNGVIPGVGMIYGSKARHVFGGMHVGFAPPRITSAISPRGEPAAVSPERSINYELGTRVAPLKWTRLEATGFLSNFSNQVIINTAPGADSALTDAGATNIYGLESGGTLALDRAFNVPTLVELAGQYTFSRAVFREGPNAGRLLPYAPQHAAHVRLDVEHTRGFGGQLAYSYLARQFSDAANTIDEDVTGRVGRLPARHIVDATLHYRHKASGVTIRLTLKNALDSTYIAARRPEGIFQGGYRQVLVGIRWDWDGAPRDKGTP